MEDKRLDSNDALPAEHGDLSSARDLERLHDQADLLLKAGILEGDEAAKIRSDLMMMWARENKFSGYNALVEDPERQVVDISNNPRRIQWLLDAVDDLDHWIGLVNTQKLRHKIAQLLGEQN